MHWILQSGWEHEPGWVRLIETLDRLWIPYSIHKVIPFVGDLIPEPEPELGDVICIGSYSMRHYAVKKKYIPGVFDLEPYHFGIQMQHWGGYMLNSDAMVLQFKDVEIDEPKFIRPIEDSKVFAGALFDPKEFHEWQEKVIVLKEDVGTSLTGETIVQVCSPKRIVQEARFWVVDGIIVTQSGYKRGNWVTYWEDVDLGLRYFADEMIEIWKPLPAFCIDICELEDGTFRIVEINTINSSGFYAADMQKLVMALEEMTYE